MNGPTYVDATPGVFDRATVTARRTAVQAELLESMRLVERYKGALAVLDELLALTDPPASEGAA